MRPPLVVIDDQARIARRYWPKPTGAGFITQEAHLCAPGEQDETFADTVEAFRLGKLTTEPQSEVAA